MNDLTCDIGYKSINHAGEQLCGDHVEVVEQEDGSTVIVLADGLGSGVKASILSTLTSKIISTMLAAGLSIEECVETIAATLPVCSVRGVAYSTFTIIRLIRNQTAELIQYDNPQVIVLRNGENWEYPRTETTIGGKQIFRSLIRLQEDDVFIAMSDGCPHAGIGMAYNFGWKREDIIKFMEAMSLCGYTAKNLSTLLVDECNKLYGGEPGDDATSCVVRVRRRVPMNMLFGPPSNRDDGDRMMSPSIAAKWLNKPLRASLDFTGDIPPIAYLEGVDLVTEGVITVNRVVEYAKDYIGENKHYEDWSFGEDGASLISRLLFEEATDINFYVGKAINPAHQNPDLPIRKFDTKVQHLKYKVLREVARQAWNDTLLENVLDIPKAIVPGKVPTMRCCVYKERAILAERVKLAMGGGNSGNIIQVIDIACDDCPAIGYQVTDSCRGCLAHRCEDVCKRGAISFDYKHEAHIDKTKCVECGQCAKVCPYSAIVNRKRPCQNACKIKAISINEENAACIDDEKCIQCGACVYQCPFGAISDRSFIINVIDMLKKSQGNTRYKVYALVAPAIGSQLNYAKLGQVITGIKQLGFYTVVEAALGADMVAQAESKELTEKGFLTSSCCPAFVRYVKTAFPALVPYISHNLSPMATIARYIKEHEENVKIVFIGPCTAKKAEVQLEDVKPYVDAAITFEELQALLDSRDIDITSLPEDVLDNASYFGRIFARSGGLSDAVAEGLKEQHLDDFELKACVCDGIEECRMALLKKSKNALNANFIEGMACVNGCIGGAGNLTHGEKNKAAVDSYGREALEKTILDAIAPLRYQKESCSD